VPDAFDRCAAYALPPDPREKELRDLRFWKETVLDDLQGCQRDHTELKALREQNTKDRIVVPSLFVLLFVSILVSGYLSARCKDLRGKLGIR
jgi:hypothetical protein